MNRPPSHYTIGPIDRKRLTIISVGMFFLFSLLIIQFYRIQILEGDKWTRVAQGQHEIIIAEPFLRGTFYSNTSIKGGHPESPRPLVVDVLKFHLFIDPGSIPEEFRGEISTKFIAILGLSEEKEQVAFKEQFYKQSRRRKLAMWLDRDTRDALREWWIPYARQRKIAGNAVFFVNDYQRSYPYGRLLGQVLHTIRDTKDEVTKQGVPTGGLEAYFNNYLKGKQGKRRLTRSLHSLLDMGTIIEAPENGADIYLTINHNLQAIAEEELERGILKGRAKEGWVVMIDPFTGEILALAQYPFFNPADYADYFNDPVKINYTKVRAVTDAYEPGSVMKPLTMTICLTANEELVSEGKKPVFNPTEKIDVSSGKFPGRRTLLADTHKSHYLNMYMALQRSSNIYVGRVIDRVVSTQGNGWYRAHLQNLFGFGIKTNIELPGESPGLLPTPGKVHPNGGLEWSLATPYSLAMGYNIQANSIQMLRAYSVLVNGGFFVQPTLIRKIVKTHLDGTEEILVDNTTPKHIQSFPRVVPRNIVDTVVPAMKYTTKDGGTAPRANIWGYTEAGKTSTARKLINGIYSQKKYLATFQGFTPVSNPRFLVLVAIDEPDPYYIPGVGNNYYGGQCAAPVFQRIAQRSLEYLGVTPDDPCGYPSGDPRYDPLKADWAPEAKVLNALYEQWNGGNK